MQTSNNTTANAVLAASTERTPLFTKPADENDAPMGSNEERVVLAKGLPFARVAVIVGTAWIGTFLSAMDSTIIATLSGPISSEFKSLTLLAWLITSYLIANAAFQPLSGRLTDIYGRGPGLLFSNICFAIGNLVCGFATDQYAMILGRAIAGIGGGGMISITTFLGSDLFPLRQRGISRGIGTICYGSGAMLGGVLGGLINDRTKMGWRLAFLVQVPPTLLSAGIAYMLINISPKQSDKSHLARIDFVGILLITASTVLLLLGLNTGGNLVTWTHPLPLTVIPVSAVALIFFVWWEIRATQPVIPVRLLRDRTVLAAFTSNFMAAMPYLIGIFYGPLYLQVFGNSVTAAGLRALSSPVGMAVAALGTGFVMNKTGKYVGLGVVSLCVMVVGTLVFALQREESPVWLLSLAFFLVEGGYGAMISVTLLACIAALDHSQQAVITSTIYLGRNLGGTIGVAVASALYQNTLLSSLREQFGNGQEAANEINRIIDNLDNLRHLPEGWYEGVMASFTEAFRGVWLMMFASAVIGFVCISQMQPHELHSTLDRSR